MLRQPLLSPHPSATTLCILSHYINPTKPLDPPDLSVKIVSLDVAISKSCLSLEELRSRLNVIKTEMDLIKQRDAQLQLQMMKERNDFFVQCMEQMFKNFTKIMTQHMDDHRKDHCIYYLAPTIQQTYLEEPEASATHDSEYNLDAGTTDDNFPVLVFQTNNKNRLDKCLGPTPAISNLFPNGTQHWYSSCPSNYFLYQHLSTSMELLQKPFQYFPSCQWDRG